MRKTYQPQSRKTYVVKRAIKREMVRGITVMFIVSAVLMCSTFLIRNNGTLALVVAIIGILLCAFSMFLLFKVNRCPYCGRFFKGLHWSAPDAGFCEGCGKLIQYTDKKQSKGQAQNKLQMQHRQPKKKKK